MRGDERDQDGMFSYISLEQRVPQEHPLRAVRKLTDAVLRTLSPEFDALYADSGRPSIAPEYILRALLLQVFYSVRSERLLVEQIDYNLLFHWFVGLGMDDAVWNHAVFSKNRDRLLTSEVAQQFFAEVNKHARRFMSDEHFTVDGTLIQAWASQKSFRSKDGSDDGDRGDFHGQKRSNKTHASTTDADARLYKKCYGKESKLSYLGHALVEIGLLQNTVYSFSMKVCGHPQDAEDTMQEVLFRSLGHLAKIQNPHALAVWLYAVTRNRCRRMRLKPAHPPIHTFSLDELMPDEAELGRLLLDAAASPEGNLLHAEQHHLLHLAVLRIPVQ
jgi:transposase